MKHEMEIGVLHWVVPLRVTVSKSFYSGKIVTPITRSDTCYCKIGNNLSYIAFYKCDGQATSIHDNRITDLGLRVYRVRGGEGVGPSVCIGFRFEGLWLRVCN